VSKYGQMMVERFLATTLVFTMLAVAAGCGGDIPLPEPASQQEKRNDRIQLGAKVQLGDGDVITLPEPAQPWRESDDWPKPGRRVRLKWAAVIPWPTSGIIAIRNMEPFAWTVLDTRLMVLAPKRQATGDRFVTFGVDATLHCPFPASVPPAALSRF
jgi:hypothetical protein